jgi:hypothetical protein
VPKCHTFFGQVSLLELVSPFFGAIGVDIFEKNEGFDFRVVPRLNLMGKSSGST